MCADYVFWLGDLNYRTNVRRNLADRLILSGRHRSLFCAADQLHREMRLGRVFLGWREAEIYFRPTFKFDISSCITPATKIGNHIPYTTERNKWKVDSIQHKNRNTLPNSSVCSNYSGKRWLSNASLHRWSQPKRFNGIAKQPLTCAAVEGSKYDSSKKRRVPSWTDRILYYSRSCVEHRTDIVALKYAALMSFAGSDHRPVLGRYLIAPREKS